MTYFTLFCGLIVALYIASDVRRRGVPLLLGVLAVVGAVLLPIVAIPLYLIFRGRFMRIKFQGSPFQGAAFQGGASEKSSSRASSRSQGESLQICPKCGHDCRQGVSVCPNCGNELTLS